LLGFTVPLAGTYFYIRGLSLSNYYAPLPEKDCGRIIKFIILPVQIVHVYGLAGHKSRPPIWTTLKPPPVTGAGICYFCPIA
jgi:hypothetical protein